MHPERRRETALESFSGEASNAPMGPSRSTRRCGRRARRRPQERLKILRRAPPDLQKCQRRNMLARIVRSRSLLHVPRGITGLGGNDRASSMADVVDPATRSRMMAGIRGTNTSPELVLRRRLHAAGLRYRLHGSKVFGRPDIVFPGRRVAIFVHGCFWHRHDGCHWCSTPSSNTEFWSRKFERNVARDTQVLEALLADGWRVALVWECGLRPAHIDRTVRALLAWMKDPESSPFFESDLVRPRGSAAR
jgi:DNA mismatch endonuclease, patch repair protein